MDLIFVRHSTAEASARAGDEGSKLTRKGTLEAKSVAAMLKAMGIRLQRILSSPMLPAAETAAIIAHEYGGIAVEAIGSLTPPGDGTHLRQRLAELVNKETHGVALVGHAPSLAELLAEMIADTRCVGLDFTRSGVAMVELPVEDAPNGAVLRWLLTGDQVEALAHQHAGAR